MAHKILTHEQITQVFSSPFCLPIFFLLSVLIVFKLAIRKPKYKTNLNQPPSPPKLPIIGNLHQLGTLPHRSLRDLSLKYGNMMLLQLGQKQTLVISSADVAMEIMKNHDLAFSNRPQNTAAKTIVYGCSEIVFGHYGENWKQKRKLSVVELLSMKSVQSFGENRKEEVDELVNKLREVISSNDACVNLSEMLLSTINNIVCKCAIGKKYEDNNVKELSRKILFHLSELYVGDYFPLLGWVDILSGKIGKLKETFKEQDALFDKVIEDRLALMKTENDEFKKKGFVDILLQLREDGMLDFELSNNDIKAIITDMIVGGTDPTTTTLDWAFAELMRHPMMMKKTQEEIRRIVGDKLQVEESDINQMHYLKCVVKETLRLHPPGPLAVPRETISNVKLKGYNIPAKTTVYVNIWAIQMDPKNWESPEVFMPERFQHNQLDFQGQDFQFIPFGFGRRGCPGINFGLATVEFVLASLLYWFDWKLPETSSSMQTIDMSEVFAIALTKKEPLRLEPIAFSF